MDKHPISASAIGQNAYYLGSCKFAEHNPPYAACLDKIKRVKVGDKSVPACCVEPIKHGTCQAVDMRKKEELAGHALYFIQREKLEQGLAKAPPWSVPATKSPVTRRERNPKMDELLSKTNGSPTYGAAKLGGTYADAINAAMQEAAAAPAATPAPTPAPAPAPPAPTSAFARFKSRPQPLPGESPIAYAKRCAAHKESQ